MAPKRERIIVFAAMAELYMGNLVRGMERGGRGVGWGLTRRTLGRRR